MVFFFKNGSFHLQYFGSTLNEFLQRKIFLGKLELLQSMSHLSMKSSLLLAKVFVPEPVFISRVENLMKQKLRHLLR